MRNPIRHIMLLWFVIICMLIMSSQRHARLQAALAKLEQFQVEGKKLRAHMEADHLEMEERLYAVEKFHNIKHNHLPHYPAPIQPDP